MTKNVDDSLMAEINITPFCDVLLVLLIIFMILAALDIPPGFQKQLSGQPSIAQTPVAFKHNIDVTIARSGRIAIDGVGTTSARLYQDMAAAVRAHARRGDSTHVALLADKDAAYDAIVKVLDAARQAGDNDVGFVTY
jgi:biopolymer transport protein ExbD